MSKVTKFKQLLSRLTEKTTTIPITRSKIAPCKYGYENESLADYWSDTTGRIEMSAEIIQEILDSLDLVLREHLTAREHLEGLFALTRNNQNEAISVALELAIEQVIRKDILTKVRH